MQVVFGIDVSTATSTVCELIDESKNEMNLELHHNKTDKTDAYNLALIQKLHHHPVNQAQSDTYKKLGALSHFYDQLISDVVIAKNRLHQALQSTFPEVET